MAVSMQLISLCACVIAAVSLANAASFELPAHLQDHPFFNEWRPVDAPLRAGAGAGSSQHTVWLALRQQNKQALDKTFWAVTTPSSGSYGRYLTPEQLGELVGASDAAINTVTSWLKQHGAAVDMVRSRDAIKATLPLQAVERAFGVRMQLFGHPDGRQLHRSMQPVQLPEHVAPHIELVHGVADFPVPQRRSPAREALRRARMTSTAPQQQQQHQQQSAAPSVQGTPGSLTVFEVAARGGALTVRFGPVCTDGSSTNTVPACADHPPILTTATLTAVGATPAGGNFTAMPVPVNCMRDDFQNAISCEAQVTGPFLPMYAPTLVSIALGFQDGSVYPANLNPYPVVANPPVGPPTIFQQYSIPAGTRVVNTAKVTQCVVEFEQQYYNATDLDKFFLNYGLPMDTPVTVIGPNPGPGGGEANLDIQYIMGVAVGAPTTFWSIYANSSTEIDDILTWEFAVGNATNPPLVNSLSYGMTSANVDKYLGQGYLARSDVEFQKLALLGISILIASGDTGSGDLGPPPMGAGSCTTLNPDWPSQSPYVTSVGATMLTPFAEPICYAPDGVDCTQAPLGEVTTGMLQGLFWGSGAGFANESPVPDWQQTPVSQYLSRAGLLGLLPPASVYHSQNRAYPDVSAIGHNLMVVLNDAWTPVDGTSASAPIFAGVVSLLNDIRLSNNMAPLGFMNPLLYQIAKDTPQAFYDVTVGNTRCGAYGYTPTCCDAAFTAMPGYDPVGGLGTPNFAVLSQQVLKYPA